MRYFLSILISTISMLYTMDYGPFVECRWLLWILLDYLLFLSACIKHHPKILHHSSYKNVYIRGSTRNCSYSTSLKYIKLFVHQHVLIKTVFQNKIGRYPPHKYICLKIIRIYNIHTFVGKHFEFTCHCWSRRCLLP